jgi:hypothetical protein
VQGSPWSANAPSGAASAAIQGCQQGITYTLTLTVRQSSTGRTASAAVTVRVNAIPAPVINWFTANSTTYLNIDPGSFVNFSWSSSNADSASSYIAAMSPGPDTCGNYVGEPWVANTTGGGSSATVQPCQQNITYTLAYTVRQSSTGRTATAYLYLHVNIPAPVINWFTANGTNNITVSAGTLLNFSWSASNADSASSSLVGLSPGPDTCGSYVGQPWVANTTSGGTSATVQNCQRNVTYTIAYTVRQSSTGRSATAYLYVHVNP